MDPEKLAVLVVEDDTDSRELLAELLRGCGVRVFAASSAAEGYELLQSGKPQLIISDIGMPVEDGYSFMRRVRELGAVEGGTTPAIALTAYSTARDRQQALSSGFQAHLAKPLNFNELLQVMGKLVA